MWGALTLSGREGPRTTVPCWVVEGPQKAPGLAPGHPKGGAASWHPP